MSRAAANLPSPSSSRRNGRGGGAAALNGRSGEGIQYHPTTATANNVTAATSAVASAEFVLGQQLPTFDNALRRAEDSLRKFDADNKRRMKVVVPTATDNPLMPSLTSSTTTTCPHLLRYLPDRLDLNLIPVSLSEGGHAGQVEGPGGAPPDALLAAEAAATTTFSNNKKRRPSASGVAATTAAGATLSLSSSSSSATPSTSPGAGRFWRLENPVHALHLASQFDTDKQWTVKIPATAPAATTATASASSSSVGLLSSSGATFLAASSSRMNSGTDAAGEASSNLEVVPPILYRDEQERLLALQTEGIPESWHPWIVHRVESGPVPSSPPPEQQTVTTKETAQETVKDGEESLSKVEKGTSPTRPDDAGIVSLTASPESLVAVAPPPPPPISEPHRPAKEVVAMEIDPEPVSSSEVQDKVENTEEGGSAPDADDRASDGQPVPTVPDDATSALLSTPSSQPEDGKSAATSGDKSPPDPSTVVATGMLVESSSPENVGGPTVPSSEPPPPVPPTPDSEPTSGAKAAGEMMGETEPPSRSRPMPDASVFGGADPRAAASAPAAAVAVAADAVAVPEPGGFADPPGPPDSAPSSGTAPGPEASATGDATTAAAARTTTTTTTPMEVEATNDPKPSVNDPEPTLPAEAVSSGGLSPKREGGQMEASEGIDGRSGGRQLPTSSVPTSDAPREGPITEARYWALFSQEEQIRMLRRAYLYNRGVPSGKKQPTKRLPTIASLQGRHGPHDRGGTAASKRFRDPGARHDDSDYQAWINEMMEARQKVNQWVFHYRIARQDYWRRRKLEQRQKPKGPLQSHPHRAVLMAAPLSKYRTFGAIEDEEEPMTDSDTTRLGTSPVDDQGDFCKPCATTPTSSTAARDQVMQCLDCLFVGTGPSGSAGSQFTEERMVKHFLATNHNFAVTCGSQPRVFCFQCGKFVDHEVFIQEKERIDVGECFPWMGWKDHPVQRSFDALRFMRVLDQGIVWSGMHATYPPLVPQEHVEATRLCMRRRTLFHGDVDVVSDHDPPESREFARVQSQIGEVDRFRPPAPVGIYNLGNTCFMSAVLQCLIHCPPLQSYFLKQIGHNHLASSTYWSSDRASKTPDNGQSAGSSGNLSPLFAPAPNEICLASELDKVFLSYYGSSIGVDVLSVLAMDDAALIQANAGIFISGPAEAVKGEPLVLADMLTAVWRCGGMSHLAGYDQRDAHEFLHGFLEIMGKHARQYRERVHRSINIPRPSNSIVPELTGSQQDAIKSIFEGTLRSVLLCSKCGSKRIQSEPFMSLSLPLSKDAQDIVSRRESLSVELCLRHFITPENLPGILCPTCQEKTVTSKQHVVAKLPKVLCLHLKRFDSSYNKKIEDFVSFPIKGLDMGPYLPHWCEVTRGVNSAGDASVATMPSFLYDLIGSVNHFGTLQSGHYVANVLNGCKWYHCNDAHVSYAGNGDGSSEVARGGGAYLLFYLRR